MKRWLLSFGLVSILGLIAVAPAEAAHRHSRDCRHEGRGRGYEERRPAYRYDSYDRNDRYDRYSRQDRYDSGAYYAPRYDRSYRYDSYAPSYYRPSRYDDDAYYDDDYYAAPPRVYAVPPRVVFHYHGHARCSRSHVSLRLGF